MDIVDKIKKDQKLDGELRQLDSSAPAGAKQHAMSASMEAVVDATKQKLNQMRTFEAMAMQVPALLPPEAQMVLQLLFSCFEKQKNVEEGIIKDIVWGFAQITPPIPPELTLRGLEQLRTQGYVKFQGQDNSIVLSLSQKIEDCWLRYEPKLLSMVYSG